MTNKMVQIEIAGETRKYPIGTAYEEIVKNYQHTAKSPILLVLENGKLRELPKQVHHDCQLEFVTYNDDAGYASYRRSATMILLKAFYDVTEHQENFSVILHFSVDGGLYFTVSDELSLTQDLLDRVEERMREIVDADFPIEKRNVSIDDAIELFHNHGMYDKEKLFHCRCASRVNIYSIEKFEDYYYGFMVSRTSYIQCFALTLYDEGFVLRLPGKGDCRTLPPLQVQPQIFQVQKESEAWAKRADVATVGDLNEKIINGEIEDVLLIQEALQEAKIAEIVEQIQKEPNRKFIMIAGPSSSGKTSFSHRLSIQLAAHGFKPHPIGLDDYFVNREDTPLDASGNRDYECLEAVDIEQFNKDMHALLEGERVLLPEFNFKTGQREYKDHYLQLGKDDILVIEGIHGLNDRLSYSLPAESKFKIYISALTQLNVDEHNRIPTTDGRLLRRIVRDARTRGNSARDTIAMWGSVRRGEEQNIFPYQESADVMFNSALIYELACLKLYAKPLLLQIDRSDPVYLEAKRLLKFLDYFVAIPSEAIPQNSLLREFVGGSCFPV